MDEIFHGTRPDIIHNVEVEVTSGGEEGTIKREKIAVIGKKLPVMRMAIVNMVMNPMMTRRNHFVKKKLGDNFSNYANATVNSVIADIMANVKGVGNYWWEENVDDFREYWVIRITLPVIRVVIVKKVVNPLVRMRTIFWRKD